MASVLPEPWFRQTPGWWSHEKLGSVIRANDGQWYYHMRPDYKTAYGPFRSLQSAARELAEHKASLRKPPRRFGSELLDHVYQVLVNNKQRCTYMTVLDVCDALQRMPAPYGPAYWNTDGLEAAVYRRLEILAKRGVADKVIGGNSNINGVIGPTNGYALHE